MEVIFTYEDDSYGSCLLQPTSLCGKHAVTTQSQSDAAFKLHCIIYLSACCVGGSFHYAALHLWLKSLCSCVTLFAFEQMYKCFIFWHYNQTPVSYKGYTVC